MGTTVFTTSMTPAEIIRDQMKPYRVEMFTIDANGACAATVIPITDDNRASLAKTYAIPEGADSVTIAFLIKSPELRGRGARSVSIKVMDESMGPYMTGGANAKLIKSLTPLRTLEDGGLHSENAAEWRAGVR